MLYRFEDFALDTDRRELRRGTVMLSVSPQAFDLIEFLVRNRERVVSKEDLVASVWAGRIVSDSALATRINAARAALGDDGKTQRFIHTLPRKGVRFIADVREEQKAVPAGQSKTGPDTTLRQEIRYCHAADGVRLAYASTGCGPRLLKAANYLNHLEYDWENPITRPLLRALANDFRLIRYDARGNGLSDWDAANVSFEAWVSDLETVVDAVGWNRFPLWGQSQGCAVSIAYAARHPERVSHLVLFGGFARGRMVRATSQAERDKIKAMATLVREGWGEENAAFRQIFTSLFLPEGTREQFDWFNELQRRTTSPANAARFFDVVNHIDVCALLSKVKAPTLVMHLREDAATPFELGREIAAGIPGAHFVPLPGRNHVPLEHDPCFPRILDEVKRFLSV